ncbi:hypothetical protein NKCBBBOE_03283 [Pseudarthrobacter sp. MM222]|nr:hypothetical protein NKCBBBOE_03283 [Pseudarthrobacter sp. MM222]
MRLWGPMPSTAWPAGMTISVDDTPHHLTILLFARHAWGIAADADVPRLDPVPDPGSSRLPGSADKAEWEGRWHRAWRRAWDWYAVQEPDPTIHPEPGFIRAATQPGQGLNPLIPPLWQADYGWDGLDAAAFSAWERECRPRADGHARTRLRRSAAALPEPQSLPALIAAWEGGLDTVIVLPYAGYFARRVTQRHLAVSAAARNDPVSYSRALGTAPVSGGSEG